MYWIIFIVRWKGALRYRNPFSRVQESQLDRNHRHSCFIPSRAGSSKQKERIFTRECCRSLKVACYCLDLRHGQQFRYRKGKPHVQWYCLPQLSDVLKWRNICTNANKIWEFWNSPILYMCILTHNAGICPLSRISTLYQVGQIYGCSICIF